MKTQKIIQSLTTILGTCVLFLCISTSAWAASPVIFYSDLTAGPNTGGQNNNGVFVTIWGNNFGTAQGSSYVTVGGGKVNNYPTWTNTMICFQLGSLASTGNIIVTTSSGSSNGLPFTVQAGNIYFVQPGASANGSGTYASPFNHLWYAYNIITAGDTVYVMAGTIKDEANGYPNYHSILCTTKSGTQTSPISWVAYPNAIVNMQVDYGAMTWTDGSAGGGDSGEYVFNYNGGNWNTFSKFYIQMSPGYTAIQTGNATGWRVVGNNITATAYSYAMVELGSNSLANNTEVIGNEIHDSGSGQSFQNMDHSIYWDGGGSNVEIAWNYLHGNKNAGWEISCFHQGTRSGKIHDNTIVAASAGSVKGILLGDVDSGETTSSEQAAVYYVYNNVLNNLGEYENGGAIQAVSGTAYIYNNTIYGSGTETMGVIQFPSGGTGPGGGHPVWYVANNIIYGNNAGLYFSDSNGNAPSWTNFSLLTNNDYYSEGNGPSQDAHPVNANPLFVSAGTNFQLQSTSPDINAGYNTSSVVVNDFNGLVRSSTPSIGAYEYASASVLPSSPVVAITSPSNGSTISAGTNITVTTTASETNGTISNISLYNGAGVLLGSSSASPYNYVMSNAVAGSYTFYAVAKDASGVSTTSSSITITVSNQSILPSSPVVTITSPASGSSYTAGSNVTITTTASETKGTISNIALYNGSGILLGSSSTSPYNYVYTNILAGTYTFYAVATDVNSVSTTSSSITVAVTSSSLPIVAITSPSNGSSYTSGSSITINASASESGGIISQVQFYNGSTLLGTDTSSPYTYTWSNVSAGSYILTAKATDTNGVSTTSSSTTVTVTAASVAPSITTQPVSVTVTAPATATFSVAATGTPTPSYQWQQEASGASTYTSISGATGASYKTPATTTANNGTKYKCVVTNSAGSVTSSAVTLTVNQTAVAPSITTQPVSVTVTAPATATFSVVATGTPAPSYQWQQEASGASTYTSISGATSASYKTPATTTANSGTKYKCVVTNSAGSVTSSVVTLTVNVLPVVAITSPANNSTLTAGSNMTITASASETNGTITDVFFYNGTTLLGSDASAPYTLSLTNLSAGTYTITAMATDAKDNSTTSSPITVTVTSPSVAPSIITQPVSVTVQAPATATFSVVATGTPAPSYQWLQQAPGAGIFTAISGATSASYTTPATTAAGSGIQYECVVSNSVGSVISNAAVLTIGR